jgi:N-acetylneuraminate synthase
MKINLKFQNRFLKLIMNNKEMFGLKKSFIIAEAGVNHNGDIELAKELIFAAKEAGADAVKFQNFKASRVISSFAEKADYQKNGPNDVESQLDLVRKLELKDHDYKILQECAKKIGITFLSTPKDIPGVDLLEAINMPIYKVGSSEINNFEFLTYIANTKKPIILSTGMCTLKEVKDSVKVIKEAGNSQITVLHCVSQYPAPLNQVNLRSMLTMQRELDLPVGYSDHTIGIEVVLAAVTLGAKVIEKHFTIDKNLIGPDHKVSMDLNEMKQMIKSIRAVESSLGDGIKKPAKCEIDNIMLLRRSLVFRNDLKEGHAIEYADMTIKRPGNGLEPKYKDQLIGKKLSKDVLTDEPISWSHFS